MNNSELRITYAVASVPNGTERSKKWLSLTVHNYKWKEVIILSKDIHLDEESYQSILKLYNQEKSYALIYWNFLVVIYYIYRLQKRNAQCCTRHQFLFKNIFSIIDNFAEDIKKMPSIKNDFIPFLIKKSFSKKINNIFRI